MKLYGLRLSLFKEPTFSAESFKNDGSFCLSWMHYDLIDVSPITTFDDFFNESFSIGNKNLSYSDKVKRLGDAQSLHLYLAESASTNETAPNIKWADSNTCTANGDSPQMCCAICVKFLVDKPIDISIVIQGLKKSISKKGIHCVCDFYKSLGADDLVILLAGNSIKEFLEVADLVRLYNQSISVATTLAFIFSVNYREGDITTIPESDCDMEVSLTITPCESAKKFIEQIKTDFPDAEIHRTSGKYDYRVYVHPGKDKIKLNPFFGSGILSSNNSLYNECVYQSKTTWYSDALQSQSYYDYLPKVSIMRKKKIVLDNYSKRLLLIEERLTKLKESAFFIGDESIGFSRGHRSIHMIKLLELLYIDFRKSVLSLNNYICRDDFCDQFEAFLTTLEYLVKNSKSPYNDNFRDDNMKKGVDISEIYEYTSKMIDRFRQSFMHYTQATRPFLDLPTTYLRYTGSYSKVLTSYYGIIKTMLEYAYQVCAKSQPRIVPLLSFEYSPKILSSAIEYGIPDSSHQGNGIQLLDIQLPFDSLSSITKYISCIAHEIGHYIVPKNVSERNHTLLKLIVRILSNKFAAVFIDSYYRKHNNHVTDTVTDKVYHVLSQIVGDTVIENDFLIQIKNIIESSHKPKKIEDLSLYDLFRFVNDLLIDKTQINVVFANMTQQRVKAFYSYNFQANVEDPVLTGARISYMEIESIRNSRPQIDDFNNLKPADTFTTTKLEKDINKWLDTLMLAIQEASSDMFAMTMLGLNLEKYILSLFLVLNDNNAFICNKSQDGSSISLVDVNFAIRMGILKDWDDQCHEHKGEQTDSQMPCEDTTLDDISEEFGYAETMKCSYDKYDEMFSHIERTLIMDALVGTESLPGVASSIAVPSHIYYYYYTKNKFIRKADDSDTYLEYYNGSNIRLINDFDKIIPLPEFAQSSDDLASCTTSFRHELDGLSDEGYRMLIDIPVVSSLKEFIDVAMLCVDRLSSDGESDTTPIWFRGQANSDYKCIPGLLRDPENVSKIPFHLQQLAYINRFEAYAYGASELGINSYGIGNSFNALVNMQHYGVPTNLLDWSENAYVALFFAVTKNPINSSHKKGDSEKSELQKDAAVYILNPEKMNIVRECLIRRENGLMQCSFAKMHSCIITEIGYPIPNFSMPPTAEWMREYGVDLQKYIRQYRDLNLNYAQGSQCYPIACMTSLCNKRIHAQQGTFTAFNLNIKAPYDFSTGGLDIEAMQIEALKAFGRDALFVFKILINHSEIEHIRKDLTRCGIIMPNLYPELVLKGERIKEETQTFLRG